MVEAAQAEPVAPEATELALEATEPALEATEEEEAEHRRHLLALLAWAATAKVDGAMPGGLITTSCSTTSSPPQRPSSTAAKVALLARPGGTPSAVTSARRPES